MCSLMEHIERDIRAREAERQAEGKTSQDTPQTLGKVWEPEVKSMV